MKTYLKNIPYYFLLFLLTLGAVSTLGLLSFGGIFVLWPIWPLALGSLVLSIAYEGEIFLQNIQGALSKLFLTKHYLEQSMAIDFLRHYCPVEADMPQFFHDYTLKLQQLPQSSNQTIIKKQLHTMEKWFAYQLFHQHDPSAYGAELQTWLQDNNCLAVTATLAKRRKLFVLAQGFSVVSGIFMGVGSTYLLSEVFTVIPVLTGIAVTTLPMIIVPMAVMAGSAYAL